MQGRVWRWLYDVKGLWVLGWVRTNMAVGKSPCPISLFILSSLTLSWMLPFCPYLSPPLTSLEAFV